MPRGFYHVRRLDLATRGEKGCLWVHRWISRRSLMLTSTWESEADAQRWLHGTSFTRTAAALQSIEGAVARVEQYRRRATLDSNGINVS
jgi:heme-degrading monooxygenase HmoA